MTELDRADFPLPIKIDSTSNGEFAPIPVPPSLKKAEREARASILDNAKRVDRPRREFLASLCGAATTLLSYNAAQAALGRSGGSFLIDPDAAFDVATAEASLGGSEFIFDVHTHMVNPAGAWRESRGKYWEQILAQAFPQGRCGEADPVDCFSADYFIDDVFMKSDTHAAVLSFVPELPEGNPLDPREAARVKTLVDRLGDGKKRLLLHAMVTPNANPRQEHLDLMAAAAKAHPIAAWKVYTQWGPEGTGWALDDPEIGIPFIEQARALGIKNICIHKGLPFPNIEQTHASCADIGRAAKLYPDVNFLVYHSGFFPTKPERAYDPPTAEYGIDSFVKTMLDNDVAPNSNVYADVGSTWRFVMRDTDQSAHAMGKLLKYVGEDRVLWGTDSIWYGSPQDQIQAFRSFEISEELQEKHGYPALTKRLKEKVFGLNGAGVYGLKPEEFMKKAANDSIGKRKRAGLDPSREMFATYGPKTMREYGALLAEKKGMPG